MKCQYACGSGEHQLARRSFLGAMAGAGALGGFSSFAQPTVAGEMQQKKKQVLLVWLAGGVSQLESWDPKPGTETGGPFRAIPTSVPGVHISELLPETAKQMHRLAIVRSVNIKENNHGKGAVFMQTGRRETPAATYPHLGSLSARLLSPEDDPLPGYIHVTPKPGKAGDAAFLGAKFNPLNLGIGQSIQNSELPKDLTPEAVSRREAYRAQLNDRFTAARRTARTEAYGFSYHQAAQLMQNRDLFDVEKSTPKDVARYGEHDFGRHCLLARRLIENDVTFVKVTHTNYDTHHENFNFHIEQLGEFDRTFATLIDDLAERGRLENTLVIVMSEFGRTPKINQRFGRDHWGTAWSVALGGSGIQPGAVVGKTNAGGTAVADREVHGGHLFHTYLQAVGIDSTEPHQLGGRPVQVADPAVGPIKELLT